jgi:predicted nucleotidyltransferase
MDKKYAITAAEKFRSVLEKNGYKITRMILFGSYANGTQREGSDIDIVIISEDFKSLDYWDRIAVLSHAIYEVFEPIEAVAYTTEEWNKGNTTIYEYAKNGETLAA